MSAIPDDRARAFAEIIDSYDDHIAQMQESKRNAYAELREELEAAGLGKDRIKIELAAFKAALAIRRKRAKDADAEDKDELTDVYLDVLARAPRATLARVAQPAPEVNTHSPAATTPAGAESQAKASVDNGATVRGERIVPADSVSGDASRPSRGGGAPATSSRDGDGAVAQMEEVAILPAQGAAVVPEQPAHLRDGAITSSENTSRPQHEDRPGSTSLGSEQECKTLGVTAGETAPPFAHPERPAFLDRRRA